MTPPPSMPSSRAGAVTTSWTWPPVRMKRNGRPSASASMWILLVNPPRERPEPGFGPPFSGRCLLVGANQSGVEHEVLILAIFDESLEDTLPHAALGPAREAGVDALPLAVSFRQVVPVRARTQHPQNGIHEQAVILCPSTGIADLAWKQADDPLPLRLGEFVPLDHRSRSESIDPEHKESPPKRNGNPECRLDLDFSCRNGGVAGGCLSRRDLQYQ